MEIKDFPAKAPRIEWLTAALAAAIYAMWLGATLLWDRLPLWALLPIGAWTTAWHMSLQHEIIHGLSNGAVDVAAIDCVSFALLGCARPDLTRGVDVIAQTPFSPGLPFVMSGALARTHLGAVRAALFATLADPALAGPRDALGLAGAVVLGDDHYRRVARIEQRAIAAGYPTLA